MTDEVWNTERLHDHFAQSLRVSEMYYDSKTEHQRLKVFQNGTFGRVLTLDDVVQTTEGDNFIYHEMLTHVPILAHGAAKRVLIIGGGDGGIAREVLKHASVEHVTMVEIDAGVVDFCVKREKSGQIRVRCNAGGLGPIPKVPSTSHPILDERLEPKGQVVEMEKDTTMTPITGKELVAWGHIPGAQFPALIARAEAMMADGADAEKIRATLDQERPKALPKLPLHAAGAVPFHENIRAETPDEEDNTTKVRETMTVLMRTPTVVSGAVMPDACPAGPLGTIPVGGIVATKNAIHPGMHSADICCSVMMSDLGDVDPKAVLDAAQSVTHFGPGGRRNGARFTTSLKLLDAFRENRFLNHPKILRMAQEHMGTQGDGNHFLFVGRARSSGRVAMVTHHGSRGPGAVLYKLGMEVAQKFRKRLSPETLKQNAWIPADSDEGIAYWEALQLIRKWTKANHNALHQATIEAGRIGDVGERIWNEHNFVFKRDGLFYHGKGATPAWDDYAPDATGQTLIPLNMSEPVLVVRGADAKHALGFSPHGAGRNFSRSEHRRRMGEVTPQEQLKAETKGLDVRFHAGGVDASELPSSYKSAASVVEQIKDYGLAEIEDYIDPYGCIMAGDVPPFWRERKKGRS